MKYIVLSLRNPPQVLSHVKMATPDEPNGWTLEALAKVAADPTACPIMILADNEPLPPIGSVHLGGHQFGPPPDVKEPLEALKEAVANDASLQSEYIQSFLDGSVNKAIQDAATHEELDEVVRKYKL